jgi:sugar lactone lactonase YvrE
MTNFELVVDGRNLVGEGPTWDERNGCLWWTDINSRVIFRLSWPARVLTTYPMPRRVGSLGLCDSGRLILAFEDGVVLHEPGTDRFDHVATIEADIVMNRLNDGKVGPDGAFWVGSMDERSPRQPTGALYRVTMQGATRQFGDLSVSNGLAWTPDGRTMLHSDSTAARIDAFDFDAATGAIANRRTIVPKIADDQGRPDGAACDAEGFYWSAGVSGGRLNRWSLAGELAASHTTPCPHPTMPCFAGPGLRTVFLTSLRSMGATDLAKYPESGGLYVTDLGVAGAPVARFRDN